MATSASPALRVSMDSIARSPPLAPASSPAATSTARLATARYTGRSRMCLCFGFTQRDVMRVPSDQVSRPRSRAPTWREDDDDCAWLHPIHEIDDVLVGHADAAGRDGLADIFRLVGAVDAVQGVLVALVKVDRPRAERIFRPPAMRLG